MKSPLWSKVLGVCLGILIGAGVAYAATYEYRAEVPASITVAIDVETVPGIEVTPTSLDFGTVAPGQSSGEVTIDVENIGDRGVAYYFDVIDLPVGMSVYVYRGGVWHELPAGGWSVSDPSSILTYRFYMSCLETVSEGPYSVTIVIREP